MRTVIKVGLVIGGLSMLAACGTNPEERTTGGAATGAGTGAVVGAVGGPVGVAAGAAIGAGVGAVTGAATKPSQVNLGKPPWANPNVNVAGHHPDTGPNYYNGYDSGQDRD